MPTNRVSSTADFRSVKRVVRGMALTSAALLITILCIDKLIGDAKLLRDFFGAVLGWVLFSGTWYLARNLAYIPRVTPAVRLGSLLIVVGLTMNFLEDLPGIASHPFYGNSGVVHAAKVDTGVIIFGVVTLVYACYFIILEVSRSRSELAEKSASLNASLAEQKNLYAALRDSETRFRSVTENVSDVIWSIDTDLNLVYVNPAVVALIGYTPREVKEKWQALVSSDPKESTLHQAILDIVKHGQSCFPDTPPSQTIIRDDLHADGTLVTSEHRVSFIPSEDGKKFFIVGVTRDITARKRAEEAVRAAARMEATATLAGGIAHDFNNLMAVVLGNASLALLDLSEEHAAAKRLKHIEDAAVKADELSSQMLAYARGGKYAPKVINLNETVRSALRIEEANIPLEVQIECHFDSKIQNVFADQSQIEQVVINLIKNGVDSVDKSGQVLLSTSNVELSEEESHELPGLRSGSHVLLTVEDTGRGMNEQACASVFEPFFTSKLMGHSRGLGLAAAYGIVKSHEGGIYVESKPGEGATFSVYLPATTRDMPKSPDQADRILGGSETVLLIDDEERILEITEKILQLNGYTVIKARNGEEGVTTARDFEGEIHLIILDMRMPVLSGPEAFPLLLDARPDTKIILCSGYALDSESQGMLDAGAVAYIKKPFRLNTLLREVKSALTVKH